jgi:serine O-acetyltransferase
LGACQKAVELSTGITLPKTAEIGPGLCLLHGGRVVVHGGARVGERCTMAHNTTLGEHVRRGLRGSPNVGDDVYVGPNSGVYGPVCVGNGAAIGANAVVFREVPDGALVRCAESETVVRGEPALSSE